MFLFDCLDLGLEALVVSLRVFLILLTGGRVNDAAEIVNNRILALLVLVLELKEAERFFSSHIAIEQHLSGFVLVSFFALSCCLDQLDANLFCLAELDEARSRLLLNLFKQKTGCLLLELLALLGARAAARVQHGRLELHFRAGAEREIGLVVVERDLVFSDILAAVRYLQQFLLVGRSGLFLIDQIIYPLP